MANPTHWQLDIHDVPRRANGIQLSIIQRNELYQRIKTEQREAIARRKRLAAETGTSVNLWK